MEKVGYVGGTFDLFHAGHARFLKRVYDLCDWVVVGLNTDKFAEKYKRRPVMSYEERKELLEACEYVDEIVENKGNSRREIEKRLKQTWGWTLAMRGPTGIETITYIFHGTDWTGESYLKQLGVTQKFLDKNNITMVYLPYTKEISSSKIIKRCKAVDNCLTN